MLVKVLTGESLFMTAFINQDNVKGRCVFAAPYPGKILPIDLTEFQGKFICQKFFLCKGIICELNSLGRGFFGGEGFIMQKRGDGLAFVHSGGTLQRKNRQKS
jgi:uncharacterized protein (AIM24 family)